MTKKSIIPSLPAPFVITAQIQKRYDDWIDYFKSMSPRIKIRNPNDEEFDLRKVEILAKQFARHDYDVEDVLLLDWPEKKNIAFILCYDSALPAATKQEFLDENIHVFCFGDIAFRINYFESVDDAMHDFTYGLQNYPPSALLWKYIATLIKDRLIAIETLVPPVPH